MHYDVQNYRLPTESRTPMLQVSHGCSYNKCNYCSLYYKTPFGMSDMEEIREDIKALKKLGDLERIYLMNGDPFALATERLEEIIGEIKKEIPTARSFPMFASVLNVQNKTDEELRHLRSLGITDLYMGSESFHNPSLALAGVGYDAEDSYQALKRLKAAGIGYSLMMILGLYGSHGLDIAREAGHATGSYMKKLNPINIAITTLFVPNNSEYGRMKRKGDFALASEKEKATELLAMFEALGDDMESYFYAFHDVSARDMKRFYRESGDREGFQALFAYYSMKGHVNKNRMDAIRACQDLIKVMDAYPNLDHYPWYSHKKTRSDIKTENPLLKPKK